MDVTAGPSAEDLIRHKQSNARVVRLEDELAEVLGHGWATPPPRDEGLVARLHAALSSAIEDRARTQRQLFPGLAAFEPAEVRR